MADAARAWSDNVGGAVVLEGRRWSFFVDRECIVCTVCADLAPHSFRMADREDHDVCFRQPRNRSELRACIAAASECPVDAIGSDGPARPG